MKQYKRLSGFSITRRKMLGSLLLGTGSLLTFLRIPALGQQAARRGNILLDRIPSYPSGWRMQPGSPWMLFTEGGLALFSGSDPGVLPGQESPHPLIRRTKHALTMAKRSWHCSLPGRRRAPVELLGGRWRAFRRRRLHISDLFYPTTRCLPPPCSGCPF
jgi:hypothetical protein